MGCQSLSLTQHSPRILDDGTPKTRLINLGNGLRLQVTPSKPRADGTYSVSRSWLFQFSPEREEHHGQDTTRPHRCRARLRGLKRWDKGYRDPGPNPAAWRDNL